MATGTPRPPEPDPDDLVAVARSLRWELSRARFWRKAQTWTIGVMAAAFIAFGLLFGFKLADTHQLAQENAENSRHLAAIVACENAYDNHFAAVQRARVAAAKRQNDALGKLIGQTVSLRTSSQFQQDVRAYQRAVAAANAEPVPPLPPAACR